MLEYKKIHSEKYPHIALKVISGHFVTPNSHINNYIDMTTMRTRQSEAKEVAEALAQFYVASTIVDTILCMEGTEVIGAYLADELTKAGVMSMNQHKTIYIATPEYNHTEQIIIRDNMKMMIEGKHVLLLLASTTTGKTVSGAVSAVQYYGGTVAGVSAIFSAGTKVAGIDINALYTSVDIPDYASYSPDQCKLCQTGAKVSAICNGFGYSELS